MFSHLGAYRTDLLRAVGGFREGYEGAQDYDLVLRCIEQVPPSAIAHIPRVLYHWRVHPESTASGNEAKPYVMDAGERALNSHLERTRPGARAEWLGYGYRVRFPLETPAPKVTGILPIHEHPSFWERRLPELLRNTRYPDFECVLLDLRPEEAPPLELPETLTNLGHQVSICRISRSNHLAAAINAAVRQSDGPLIALLHPELEPTTADWLHELASHATRPGIGAVGPRLWSPDGTIREAGTLLGLGPERCAGPAHHRFPKGDNGYFGRLALCSNFSAVSDACLLVQKSRFEEVGGFDESGHPGPLTGLDFCLKLRAEGYRHLVTPYADFYIHSTDQGSASAEAKALNFMKVKWGHELKNDPFYSPNLSLNPPYFTLAFPPRNYPAPADTGFTSG